jgi:hypothetical protein
MHARGLAWCSGGSDAEQARMRFHNERQVYDRAKAGLR